MSGISKVQERLWQERNSAKHYWKWKTGAKRSAWFAKVLDAYNFGSVFEVGCNSGRNLKHIVDRFPGISFGGLDINAEAVSLAKANMPAGKFEVGSAYDLDTANKYDLVFTCGTLIHIPEERFSLVLEKMLQKSNRYLMHLEQLGSNTVLNAPKEYKPKSKVKNKFRWAPDIAGTYVKLGIDKKNITTHNLPSVLVGSDCTHLVIVKL